MAIYSYKNAKKGLTYRARAVTRKDDPLTVDSFLDVFKGSTLVETKTLATDKYKQLRG